MLMLADSVESDRLVLLSKAHAAWKVDSVDKASRILQRLRAQTEDSATIATTPAQSNGSSSSSSSSSASAPAQRVMHPVPIVSVAPTEAPAVSATPHSHTRELANGFRVPLLAPALHTPAVTITPSVPLPTGRQPPLFLVLHNTALLHLRAGKLKLAQIFLARAVSLVVTLGRCSRVAVIRRSLSCALWCCSLFLCAARAFRVAALLSRPSLCGARNEHFPKLFPFQLASESPVRFR